MGRQFAHETSVSASVMIIFIAAKPIGGFVHRHSSIFALGKRRKSKDNLQSMGTNKAACPGPLEVMST